MDRIKNKQFIILLIILIGLSGCIGTNEEVKIPIPTPSPFENEKLGTGLNYTAYLYETQGIDAAVAYLKRNPNRIIEKGNIGVRISITENNETYIKMLKSMSIEVLDVIDATDIGGEISVEAFLPIPKIREVGELKFVKAVYVESKPALD